MWTDQKRERFQQLRQRENALTEAEQAELVLLVQELEDAEAASLALATERLGQEREIVEAKNRKLEVVVCRKETLMRRLRDFLAETQAERRGG